MGLKFTTNQLIKLLAPLGFGAIASAAGLLPMFWINALLMMLGRYLADPKKRSAEAE